MFTALSPRSPFNTFPFDVTRHLFDDAPTPATAEPRFPRFSWKEVGDTLLVSADLPGLSEKDVSITIDDDVVKVKGERKASEDSAHRPYAFDRSLRIAFPVDVEASTAVVKDGVLTLRLVRAKADKTRQIPVKAG